MPDIYATVAEDIKRYLGLMPDIYAIVAEDIKRYLSLRYTPDEIRRIHEICERQMRDLGVWDSHDDWRALNRPEN